MCNILEHIIWVEEFFINYFFFFFHLEALIVSSQKEL